MRGRSLRRPTGWFAVALVLAAAAAVLTARAAAGGGETAGVLVAAAELSAGERIGDDPARVRVITVPRDAVLPGIVQDAAGVAGRHLAVPVATGEPITLSALGQSAAGARPLAVGERAISVPLTAAGAAAVVLVPTSRVDVAAAVGTGPAARSAVIVRGAEVIALSTPPDAGATGALDAGAVLLRVDEAGALALSAALDLAGGVRLLPRPAAEQSP